MIITLADLTRFSPLGAPYLDAFNQTFARFGIDNEARLAAFMAQTAHESGAYRWTREIWGPTPVQLRYEGRADLGNVKTGDGFTFRGRGFIQITGRTNYTACSRDVYGDPGVLLVQPQQLETSPGCALSAGWFWARHGLNELADAGNFSGITRRINGGLTGEDDREKWWSKAKTIWG